MSYTPSHSRSKSYAYGGSKTHLPPPPTDSELTPVDYHVPHNGLYRRHSRKKSSQVLIEPIGVPVTNHMPVSPSFTVPPALQTMFDKQHQADGSDHGEYDAGENNTSLKRHVSSAASSTYTPSPLATGYVPRRRNTISHKSHASIVEEKVTVPEIAVEDHSRSPDHHVSGSDNEDSPNTESDRDESKSASPDFEKRERSSSTNSNASSSSTHIQPAKKPSAPTSSFSANTLASGASFLIAGQFFAKLLTFTLNQLILRFIGPESFGANAQLELLINTILFFSREAIRLAAQRESLTGKHPDVYRFEGGVVENTQSGTVQQVINIGFVPLVVGIPLATVLSYLYIHFSGLTSEIDSKTVSTAVVIFAISSILELAAEPGFLLYQFQLQFRKRASFESIAIFARCLLTVMFLMIGRQPGTAIIAFSLGQFAYSSVLATLYIFNSIRETRSKPYDITFPRGVWKEGDSSSKVYFSKETTHLAGSIWLQTIFKHCLTEGDKFLISLLLPIADQGVYAVVVNYGSLIARLVFLPIEEALRNFFSKLLSPPVNRDNLKLSVTVISTLLRIYVYLSIFAIAFGPMVSSYVLQFLVSRTWLDTDAPVVLATYACYIPFLAINGVLESFVQSVAAPADIKRQSSALLAFSLSFAAAAYVFMRPLGRGAQGLVLANMFNMAQRIGWCIMWIEEYYSRIRNTPNAAAAVGGKKGEDESEISPTKVVYFDKPWGWLLLACPRSIVFGMVAGLAPTVWILGQVSTFKGLLQHVFLAVLLLLSILFAEKELILEYVQKYKAKTKAEEVAKKK